ncbi:MAG TPA: tRNA (adenosine(37)-N6)-threonylcarbamoyltransferase complex dimerization subunit type 1 TsaB [Gemmataceae bacterium]|nr:tRNA (adenosine(37)-N6)-threonylcarbamoyltransferase complex dimerization subunit type 1 TsaB [Gemmataceae bacterium]
MKGTRAVLPKNVPGKVKDPSSPRILILETSGRTGHAALARGNKLLRVRRLDETRRHASDLAPAVGHLLVAESWKPAEIQALIVSRGPGSYTGLRVGIMAAKIFTYATGIPLIAVDTFAAIAHQLNLEIPAVHIVADAQQDKVYVQRFVRLMPGKPLSPITSLTIISFADWLQSRELSDWVSGPGLRKFASRLPGDSRVVPESDWDPQPKSFLHIGLARYHNDERDDPWTLEPLYLRPSAAEEKWQKK